MKFKKIILLLSLIILSNTCFSLTNNDGTVFKGQLYNSKEYLGEINGIHYLYTYGVIYKMDSNYEVLEKFKTIAKREDYNFFKSISILDNKIITVFNQKNKENNSCIDYVVIFNPEDMTIIKDKLVTNEYSFTNDENVDLTHITSKNNKYISIVSQKYNSATDNLNLIFKIFDLDFHEIYSYELNNKQSDLVITDIQIDNNSNIIVVKEDKSIIVTKINNKGLTSDVEIKINDKKIIEYDINISKLGEVECYGFFSDIENKQLGGFFNTKIDQEFTKLTYLKIEELDKGLLNMKWNDYKEKPKEKFENDYYDLVLRDVIKTDNNSTIIIAEQSFSFTETHTLTYPNYNFSNGSLQRESYSTSNTNSSLSTGRYDYAKDIVIIHILEDGSFDWVKTIKKKQYSRAGDFKFISFNSYLKDNKLHIVYNDDKKNITTSEKVTFEPYSYSNIATFDNIFEISDGSVSKTMLFEYSKTKNMIISDINLDVFKKNITFMRHGMLNCGFSTLNLK
jgi:hypothetical protein